jgi:hypothetical protein
MIADVRVLQPEFLPRTTISAGSVAALAITYVTDTIVPVVQDSSTASISKTETYLYYYST